MQLYTSHRLEHLRDALAQMIQHHPLPPLQSEIIVVQSQGMARWLSLSFAAQLGVWANADYPFPRAMSWRAYQSCLSTLPDTSLYEPGILHWTLLRLLPQYLDRPAFQDLHQYFAQDEQGLKHTQLAQRIASSFDQYVIYRPDVIQAWEAGQGEDWQAQLWRAIREDYQLIAPNTSIHHRATVHQDFLHTLKTSTGCPGLPQRLHIFGISALPPMYLDLFSALSQHCEIHLFVMNPCEQYWGDIVSDADIANINLRQERKRGEHLSAEEQYFTTGNSLLASMGKMGRDFIDLINEYAPVEHSLFSEPETDTLLHCLQSDILLLEEKGENGRAPYPVSAEDFSVQVHSCHSALREVEVLHDQLLALMERDAELQPGDILIMMPDIETYAPLIETVFATIPDQRRRIPFSIADRSMRQESRIIDTFLSLLELPQTRLTLAQVLGLLEVEAVQKCFELSFADLEKLQVWLDNAYVRWGIDTDSRTELGLPAFKENSWAFGLERLLLGYALPNQDKLYAGILPLDAVEGQDSRILSQFLIFADRLFNTARALNAARSPIEWVTLLQSILNQFFATDVDSQTELQRIRDALNQFSQETQTARFDAPLSPVVMHQWLNQNLEQSDHPVGFITGQVTFCAMLPMRSIPFKVIGLLGMNERDYPRSHRAPGFDLISAKPRRGDRSRRHDDRYLFLETLLSARDTLYISYQGQSIRDNSEQPPSVLVSELLNYIEQGFVLNQGEIRPHVWLEHPLQAFSPRYFEAQSPRLFSYAQEYVASSQQLLSERRPLDAFIDKPLSPPESSWQQLDALQLVRFFRNPSAYLLQQRLHVYPELQAQSLAEQEPLEFAGLEKYQLDTHLLEKSLNNEDLHDYYSVIKASGQLPPEPIGSTLYQDLCGDIDHFAEQVRPLLGSPLPPLNVDLKLGELRLSANFSRIYPHGALFYRPSKIKPTDLLRAWIYHLLLNAAQAAHYPRRTDLLGTDQQYIFSPVNNPRLLLRGLLQIYQQGLSTPQPFFPATSLAYAEKIYQGKDRDVALKAAEAQWLGGWYSGEGEEAHYRLCFRQGLVLDKTFQSLAKTVFIPLLKARNSQGDD